jgi:murein L,D-transpeptidase YcbB/YkuD
MARGKQLDNLQQFFDLIEDKANGIHPEDFGYNNLWQQKPSDLIRFDIQATSVLARYAAALARKDADVKSSLTRAINSNSVAQLAEELAPRHVEYSRLKTALQSATDEYRSKIELNMDRWRKQPDDLGHRHIRINVPAFELEVHEGAAIPLKMKVVVGANDNKTPLFSNEMKYVVFSPYWNIPESILAKEMLPKIIKDPEYAERQNLEFIRASGKRMEVVDPGDIDWGSAGASDIQVRQKPGSSNSLGLVKFIFPNRYNVYLDDTPSFRPAHA